MREILLLCESVAVVVLAFLINACLRQRSAAERHALWVVTFIALLLLPMGRLLPETSSPSQVMFSTVLVAATGAGVGTSTEPRAWLLYMWVFGAILLVTRIVVGMVRGFLLVRRAHDAEIANTYVIRYSRDVAGPVAWGLGRKVMLLPFSAQRWDRERRSVVLSHEAAHLRRNDCWALLIAEGACALFWCNPLVWIAASRLRREQEHAADDEVLRTGVAPANYAGHLVALARATRPPILAAGAITQSQLTARVEAILDPRRFRRMPSRTMILATVLALLVVVLPLASMQAERKVERIGDKDVTAPRPIQKQEPQYTEEARDAKIEGTVTMSVVIEADGRIYEARVVKGLDPGLDANALAAVRTWVFEPATKRGEPVAVSANIEVNFRLL